MTSEVARSGTLATTWSALRHGGIVLGGGGVRVPFLLDGLERAAAGPRSVRDSATAFSLRRAVAQFRRGLAVPALRPVLPQQRIRRGLDHRDRAVRLQPVRLRIRAPEIPR